MEAHYDNLNKKLDNLQSKCKGNTKTTSNSEGPRFHPRTVNLTKIEFTKEGTHLLDLGLKHRIEKPLKTYWTNLIMETEGAIKLLDPKLKDPHRILAAKKIQQISNSSNQNRGNQKRQAHIIKSINNKLATEKAMIVRVDKGRTIMIINTDEYTRKVQNFFTENNFHGLHKDPTKRDHKILQKLLQQCNLIIDKKKIKFLTQKNPQPPTLNAQIKLHKHGHPIRPVINNTKTPSYKIAKHLTDVLSRHLHLSNQYNVKNSITLAENLTKIEINENHKLITYDIKDLYANIPIHETLKITKLMLNKENNAQITKQIITLLDAILKQNYFEFQNNLYQLKKESPWAHQHQALWQKYSCNTSNTNT